MNITTYGLMPTFRPTLEAIYLHMENGCRACRTTGHPVCPEGARLARLDVAACCAEVEARRREARGCSTCDGTGWYAPTFAPGALVNCAECNDDWSKGTVDEDDES